MSRPNVFWITLLSIALAACSGVSESDSSSTSSTITTTVTTIGATSSTTTLSTTTLPVEVEKDVALVPTAGEMESPWTETMFIPYGTTLETLGTSPGGDTGSLDIGPEYGAQTADGTWWFLDAAKRRIARFSDTGEYMGQVEIPEDLLVDGIYFQYQLPKAFDDGKVVAVGFRELGTALLEVTHEGVSAAEVAGFLVPMATDGRSLFMSNPDDGLLRLDPHGPSIEPVEWLSTRQGSRYAMTLEGSTILVELPDNPGDPEVRIDLRWADDPEVPVRVGIQVDSGVDGALFLFLYGAPETQPTVQLTGS